MPKPNTPLQWDAICDEKELKKRIKYVCKGLRRIPNVEVRFMSARIAHEQALFSSGDRTVSRVIEAAARYKGDFERALRETGVDAGFHTSRDRGYDEFLPWSIVDSGLSFEFLKEEHEKSQEALSSKPCPAVEKCTTCGVCPTTWLADAPEGLIQIQPMKVREALAACRLVFLKIQLFYVFYKETCRGRRVVKMILIIVNSERKNRTCFVYTTRA